MKSEWWPRSSWNRWPACVGICTEQIGHQAGAVVIVDAEHLQDAGIAQEGAGALAIRGAELMNVLQDRPELDAIAGHQAHGLLTRRQAPQRREFIEEVEDWHRRAQDPAPSAGPAFHPIEAAGMR